MAFPVRGLFYCCETHNTNVAESGFSFYASCVFYNFQGCRERPWKLNCICISFCCDYSGVICVEMFDAAPASTLFLPTPVSSAHHGLHQGLGWIWVSTAFQRIRPWRFCPSRPGCGGLGRSRYHSGCVVWRSPMPGGLALLLALSSCVPSLACVVCWLQAAWLLALHSIILEPFFQDGDN